MQTQDIKKKSGDWLTRMMNAPDVGALRNAMARHYPDVEVGALRTVAVVGAAGEGRRLCELCDGQGVHVDAHADDDPAKIGTNIGGRVIEPVSQLVRLSRDIVVLIASHRVLGAAERLRSMGFRNIVPFAALQVMAPELFPPHMFYAGLLEDMAANADQYRWLHDVVADDRSREVLDAVLAYRQTLDPFMLKPVFDDDDLYAPKGLFKWRDDEVYVDGGSYDGDTIRSFVARLGGRFKAIYAFEPDPVTFQKLKANFAGEPRVQAFHAGLHSKQGSLRFRDDASRGAIFAADGEIEMPVTTIDHAVGDAPVTYIKMNIEGAEIDALRGSRATIQRSLPRLAISVYHRASDLWRIPRLVRELGPAYDLYLRQHDGGIIETVLYAVSRS